MLSMWKWLDPKVIRGPWLCIASQVITIIALHHHQLLYLVSLPSFKWVDGEVGRWWDGMGWYYVKGKALKWLAQSLAHSKHLINVPFSLLGLWRWDLQICCWDDCSRETMCLQKVAVVISTLGICLPIAFYLLAWLNGEEKQRVGSNHSSSQDRRILCGYSKLLQKLQPFLLLRFFFLMGCYFFCCYVTWIQNGMCLWYFTSKKP